MLSDDDVRTLERWVDAARLWGESSQRLVDTATELTILSESLAERLVDAGTPMDMRDGNGALSVVDRERLAADLRSFAQLVEEETSEFRDRYLAVAASIEQYGDLLG